MRELVPGDDKPQALDDADDITPGATWQAG
jgi:hypothetical protein